MVLWEVTDTSQWETCFGSACYVEFRVTSSVISANSRTEDMNRFKNRHASGEMDSQALRSPASNQHSSDRRKRTESLAILCVLACSQDYSLLNRTKIKSVTFSATSLPVPHFPVLFRWSMFCSISHPCTPPTKPLTEPKRTLTTVRFGS
jgi:hypothetical protein